MSHSFTAGIPADWKAKNGLHVLESIVDKVFAAFAAYDRLVLELFAGPGGMSHGLELAGINPRSVLGVEWDASACMTAVRAGHPRLHADLTLLDPRVFGKVWGFHASPSCQGFSMAGKGESRGDTDLLLWAIREMGARPDFDAVEQVMAHVRERATSPLSSLSLEPLRYILALRPEWITLEQVRAVLPLWEAYAEVLRPLGYSVHTSVVHSEQYGVPQTRTRAILLASLVHDVSGGMIPTHSKFHTAKSKRGVCDQGVLPYVTMAQALERAGEYAVVSNYGTHGVAEDRGERQHDEPAATVTSKAGRNKIVGARVLNSDERPQERPDTEPSFTVTGSGRHAGFEFMGDVRQAHGAVRAMAEPAATITSAMDNGNFQWVTDPEKMRESLTEHPERVNNQSGTDFDLAWPTEQPSPTIAGREIVGMPGANANRFNGSTKSRNDGLRVTVAEAGILQSFPADYPWTGTLTKQYEQAGNAVPPLLGRAMAETVIGIRKAA